MAVASEGLYTNDTADWEERERKREMKCAKHSGHVRSGNILLIWTEYQEDWNGYTWIKT